jgi:hypothetical protein
MEQIIAFMNEKGYLPVKGELKAGYVPKPYVRTPKAPEPTPAPGPVKPGTKKP